MRCSCPKGDTPTQVISHHWMCQQIHSVIIGYAEDIIIKCTENIVIGYTENVIIAIGYTFSYHSWIYNELSSY